MEGRVEKEVILHEMKFENDYKEFLKEKKNQRAAYLHLSSRVQRYFRKSVNHDLILKCFLTK